MPDTTPTTFGPRLRLLREQAGLSQSELARRAGLAPHHVCRYERGDFPPSWANACRLADALGVSVADFREPSAESLHQSRR